MALQAFTKSRRSFERTTHAIEAVGDYLTTRQLSHIEAASKAVDEALVADRNYALAVFYRGVIHDLGGAPADAIPLFERVVNESSDTSMQRKAKFNLGVAYYHQYSHVWLERAARYFEAVQGDPNDVRLQKLAKAHLAQVHAMWMRPSSEQAIGATETTAHIKYHYEQSLILASAIKEDPNGKGYEKAVALNALGMASMYLTDFVLKEPSKKLERLNEAKASLDAAAKTLSDDWANTCDLASVALRLGVLAKQEGRTADAENHFEDAKEKLDLVVQRLRPNYGFALFESGILHRVWGKFHEAVSFLERARKVPANYRNVDDVKVEKELAAAKAKKRDYPLT